MKHISDVDFLSLFSPAEIEGVKPLRGMSPEETLLFQRRLAEALLLALYEVEELYPTDGEEAP